MIKILSINKNRSDCYNVTVQDTLEIVGKDEQGVDVCWTCSAIYNPVNGKESLKTKIENIIKERKALGTSEDAVLADIKESVELIDTTKLEVK